MKNKLGDHTESVDGYLILLDRVINRTFITWGFCCHIRLSEGSDRKYHVEISIERSYKIMFSRGNLTARKVIFIANQFKINLNE